MKEEEKRQKEEKAKKTQKIVKKLMDNFYPHNLEEDETDKAL